MLKAGALTHAPKRVVLLSLFIKGLGAAKWCNIALFFVFSGDRHILSHADRCFCKLFRETHHPSGR